MKQNKISVLTLLALMVCGATSATAQQTHPFSVVQAVEYARKNSIQVKNALLDVRIQQQTNREITASAFPQIGGNVAFGYNPNVAVQQFPNFIAAATYGVLEKEGVNNNTGAPIIAPSDFGLVAAAFGTKYNASAGATLQQLLFDGQVFVGLQARATSIEYQNKAVEVTEEDIKTNIYKIYYQLSASRAQLQLLDANIERLRKLQSDFQIMYDNGFAEKLDVNRAGVQLANLQTERERALNSINNGYVGLKLLLGMPLQDSLVLTDSVTEAEIRAGVLENVAYNVANRKEYQLAELGRKLRQFDIKRYKLTYFPTVALSASYSRLTQTNTLNYFSGAQWFPASSIGLNINIPIFDGFARAARIQRAKLQLQQAENGMEGLRQSIGRDVETALNNYRSALSTLETQKRNIELAELVYNQTKLKREQGLGTTTEITSAQTDLQIAQSNYILSLYDASNAKVEFLRATGKL